MRWGHSTSTGATARNNGPGKSPLLPIPDCASASSVAISPRRSLRPVELNGSTGAKSTVPAIVVFRLSVGKRVMVRMPDSPAVSLVQLSALPVPSDVTIPMPVTTTIGLPKLSRGAAISSPAVSHLVQKASVSLLDRFDQSHALAPPVACADHHDLGRRALHFNLGAGGIARGEQCAARERQRRKPQSQRKLGFHGVTEPGAGRADRKIPMLLQKGTLLRCDGFGPGRAGDDGAAAFERAELRP